MSMPLDRPTSTTKRQASDLDFARAFFKLRRHWLRYNFLLIHEYLRDDSKLILCIPSLGVEMEQINMCKSLFIKLTLLVVASFIVLACQPEPAPAALPSLEEKPEFKVGSTLISEKDGMVMVYIPAGEFQMGSETGDNDEKPIHNVYLDAFWIDQTEVTNAMYANCVAAGGCAKPSSAAYLEDGAHPNHPVAFTSWKDASSYCTWAGRRLPTEAEWEKAARGGLESKSYPWGDETPVCDKGVNNGAQKSGCGGPMIPVASFGRNGYGLYDMAGNVWEWVADWYSIDYYSSSPGSNPTGPLSGEERVVRGGSWPSDDSYVRSASRGRFDPVFVAIDIGFRCSRSAASP